MTTVTETTAPGAEWREVPPFDNRQATAEGWDLFERDSLGTLEIQRDDERRVFPDDTAALAHVAGQARTGSAYHRRALQIHADTVGDRAMATILAALRMWQRLGPGAPESDIADSGGEFTPLGADEIDTLCEDVLNIARASVALGVLIIGSEIDEG